MQLNHLTITNEWAAMTDEQEESVGAALFRCLLRCPSLLSCVLDMDFSPPTAVMRHLAGSARLRHLELSADEMAGLVWGDGYNATRPWTAPAFVQSFALRSNDDLEDNSPFEALCRSLPALTQLHLCVEVNPDALQSIARHMGDRLTFLGVYILTAKNKSGGLVLTMPRLPAALTCLQIRGCLPGLLVTPHQAGAGSIELLAALPPSLLSLSLTLHHCTIPYPSLIAAKAVPAVGALTRCHRRGKRSQQGQYRLR